MQFDGRGKDVQDPEKTQIDKKHDLAVDLNLYDQSSGMNNLNVAWS